MTMDYMFVVLEVICILVLVAVEITNHGMRASSTGQRKRRRARTKLRFFPTEYVLWPTLPRKEVGRTYGHGGSVLQGEKVRHMPQSPSARDVSRAGKLTSRNRKLQSTPRSYSPLGSRKEPYMSSREGSSDSKKTETFVRKKTRATTPLSETALRSTKHSGTASGNAPTERPSSEALKKVELRASDHLPSNFSVPDMAWTEWKPERKVPKKTWFEESKTAAKDIMDKGPLQLNSKLLKFYEEQDEARTPFYQTSDNADDDLLVLLHGWPHRYKRCKLKLISAQSASAESEDSQIIEISGRSKIGRTYNDDEVVVEIKNYFGSNEINFETTTPVFGEVMGVLQRHRYSEVDHPILPCIMDEYESWLMHPLCKTVPKIRVLHKTLKGMPNEDKKDHAEIFNVTDDGWLKTEGIFPIPAGHRERYVFLVAIVTWGVSYMYPLGVVLKKMKTDGNYGSAVRVLEFQHAVPRMFPRDCVQAVDKPRPSRLDFSKQNRRDLTKHLAFTIDPDGARDLDDALSLWREKEHYVVGVHIADVSAVVEKGDSVDVEARRRGCTFYPPGGWRTYPMLPEPLSQGRCSLLPGEPRPTLSLLFHLDDKGEQHGQPQLFQAVIRSSRQLTYTQAQRIIDGHDEPDEHTKELFTAVQKLSELASNLRIRRLRQGAHHHRYRDPRLSGREEEEGALDAHDLVEEFMVKTNLHIAQRLFAAFPDATLLRSQDAPKADKLQKWLETGGATCHFLLALQDRMLPQGTLLSAAEYCKETSSSSQTQYLSLRRDIWYSLKLALARGDIKAATRLITIDDLHPSQLLAASRWNKLSSPAVYSCSTVPDPERNNDLEPNGHYTLQARAYCHFTSPIRRYADVVVHRMVKAMLADAQSPVYEEDEVKEIAEELTKQEVKPRHFERDCRDLHLADRLSEQPLQVVGVVGGVSTHGLDLCITGMDCPPRSLQDVPFNLLNLCSQPEVRSQARSSEQEVTCRFRRRIYNAGEYSSSHVNHRGGTKSGWNAMTAEDRIVQVNEHHLMVTVSARLWCRLLETLLSSKEGRLQSLREQVDRVGPEGEKQQRPGSRNIISCESGDGHAATQVVTFERTFAPGQAVHLQLGAGHERSMLVPRVSLLWLSDNLHLCLDHVRDPVPQLVPQAVKAFTRAKDLEDYVDTWLPLLEMEGATEAVQGEGGVIVEDVKVSLTQDWTGDFTLQSLFCEDRCLDVGGRPQHLIKNKDICVGPCTEHVCLRIPLPGTQSSPASTSKAPRRKTTAKDGCDQTAASKAGEKEGRMKDTVTSSPTRPLLTEKGQLWIGHGRVVSVCGEAEEMVKVTFELRREFIPPPRCLVDVQHVTGTVEILPVPETQRRPAAVLQELLAREAENEAEKEQNERLAHDLARAIALRRDIPVLEKSRLRQAEEIEKDLKPRPLDLPLNNPSQEDAITRSLKSTFSLIHGPPGTGKSYTGVKLVYLFYKINTKLQEKEGAKKQILFCGPSNKSVDVAARLAKKYLSKMTPSPKIARMYGKSMEELDFPVPGRTLLRKGGGDRKCDPDLHDITIHHIIRKAGKPYAEDLRRCDNFFTSCGNKMDDVAMKMYVRYTRVLFKATTEELGNHDIIFCTCSVAGNKKVVEGTQVFQVMVDECAMCPEPLCLVPVIANQARQVVLIGDHKQLKPIVKNRRAGEMGLSTSLFERYHFVAPMLDKQYRMNPPLCDFPSRTFYDGKLKTGKSKSYLVDHPLSLWPQPEYPHVFVHVEGVEGMLTVTSKEGNEMSKSNAQEARKVVQIVRHMVAKEGVPPSSIYVMSQYNAQCHVIKESLQDKEIEVNTVVASQGGEWDYVVFSTVRSLTEAQIENIPSRGWRQRHLGFIIDQNQINVALTRAKKGLIIVGNKHLLRKDDVWKKLLQHYKQRNTVVEGREFPLLK